MAEIARDVDLSKTEGAPTQRAVPQLQLESSGLEAKLPGGTSVKHSSQTFADSPQAAAHTTLVLVVAGCLAATIPLAAGAPIWVTIAIGAFLPPALLMLVRFGYRRWSPR
jgi:hypothetical protein